MKKKIIIIQFFKFLDFHYKNYEIEYLKKYFDVEIHDLSYFLNKNIHKDYFYKKNSVSINIYNNFFEWIKKIFSEKAKYGNNLYLLYTSLPLNFKFCFSHFLFLFKNINIIFLKNYELPQLSILSDLNFKNFFLYKIERIFKRPKHVFYFYKSQIIESLIKIISRIYPPKIIFSNSKVLLKNLKHNYPRTKIISINSWDASKIYIKNNKKLFFRKKYGVYLAPFSEKSSSDSNAFNSKRIVQFNPWYKEVDLALNKIEKKFKKKIKIALHPRSESFKKFKLLSNRDSFINSTMELIRKSDFVVLHTSVAVSYSTLFFKPIIFISVSESARDIFFDKWCNQLAKFFGNKINNLSDLDSLRLDYRLKKEQRHKYNYYNQNYLLSSRFKRLSNYMIIKNEIQKLKK